MFTFSIMCKDRHRSVNYSIFSPPSSHTYLLLSGDLSCDQKPEEALRQRLVTSWSFRQQLLTLWNAVTPETDSLSKGGVGGMRSAHACSINGICSIMYVQISFQHRKIQMIHGPSPRSSRLKGCMTAVSQWQCKLFASVRC